MSPKDILSHSQNPSGPMVNVVRGLASSSNSTCQYLDFRSKVENQTTPYRQSKYLLFWVMYTHLTTSCHSNTVLEQAQITTFHSGLHRWDKALLWCESPPIHLASLCDLSHFWHPCVGSIQSGRILKIWFGSVSCGRSRLSLKLPNSSGSRM